MRIVVDLRRNVLRLHLREQTAPLAHLARLPAVLDIGERGALLGLELSLGGSLTLALPHDRTTPTAANDTYLALSDETSPLARSAKIEVEVLANDIGEISEIIVPRRGPDFEISFPSGNQCWLPKRSREGTRQPVAWCSVFED